MRPPSGEAVMLLESPGKLPCNRIVDVQWVVESYGLFLGALIHVGIWWTRRDSNPRPPRCERCIFKVKRDLQNSKIAGLSNDWRLGIAYNAALQAATAALAAAGYRAARDGNHHYRIIQSLELTIGAEAKLIRALDGFRKKRHVSNYDAEGSVSDREAKEIQKIAARLRDDVRAWLTKNNSHLL